MGHPPTPAAPSACRLSRAFRSAPVRAEDLRPALAARAGVWRIGAGCFALAPGGQAALLAQLGGPPLSARFGEAAGAALRLTRGGVLSIPAGLPVRLRSSGRAVVLALTFDEALLRGAPAPVTLPPIDQWELRAGLLPAPNVIGGLADLLAADLEGRHAAGPALGATLTRAMIDCAASDPRLARRREAPGLDVDPRVRRVIDLIRANLSRDLRLGWLAAQAGISPSHLSRGFRNATGVNLMRYVRESRLEQACRMLEQTREPLAEISYACGFSSQSHMTTAFRLSLGTTPLAYRLRRQQQQPAGERPSPAPWRGSRPRVEPPAVHRQAAGPPTGQVVGPRHVHDDRPEPGGESDRAHDLKRRARRDRTGDR